MREIGLVYCGMPKRPFKDDVIKPGFYRILQGVRLISLSVMCWSRL